MYSDMETSTGRMRLSDGLKISIGNRGPTLDWRTGDMLKWRKILDAHTYNNGGRTHADEEKR